jgi:hypothetical protein
MILLLPLLIIVYLLLGYHRMVVERLVLILQLKEQCRHGRIAYGLVEWRAVRSSGLRSSQLATIY